MFLTNSLGDDMGYKEDEIEVEGIGKVSVSYSARAKYVSIRIKPRKIVLVVPGRGTLQDALVFLDKKREWVKAALKKNEERLSQSKETFFDESGEYKTLTFTARIMRVEGVHFQSSLKDGVLTISCPRSVDIKTDNVQTLIRKVIERAMMAEAKRVLPERLSYIAQRCGLRYVSCRIRNVRSIWGSCTRESHISLNLYLMRLPQHLIDYVLIHELCHTVEMNHSDRFWALVDSYTGGKAKSLRKELRGYCPGF